MSRMPLFHKLIDGIIVLCLAVIVFAMILQVLARYVFHAALPWPEELAQLLLVVLSFLGMYRAIEEDQHIRLDVFPPEMQSRLLRLLKAAGLLAACFFVGYIGYGGYDLAIASWAQPSIAMRAPMGLFYMVIPISCALSVLAFLGKIHLLLMPKGSAQ